MTKLPACSSDEVMKALLRAGFVEGPTGAHQKFVRTRDDGGKDITVVPRAKREIPRGTLRKILELANMSDKEFLELLR